MEGKFITIYGINNIGKTTHAKLLVERLEKEGHKARYVKYPVYDADPSGPFIDAVLRGEKQKISEEELQLWFVVNRYQFEGELKRLLEEGYIVIAEDYRGTGIAWGIAKGLSEEWMESINSRVLPEDLAILMEGQRDIRAKEEGHVHEQDDELAAKCAEVHSRLADKYGWKRVRLQEKIQDTAGILWGVVDDFIR